MARPTQSMRMNPEHSVPRVGLSSNSVPGLPSSDNFSARGKGEKFPSGGVRANTPPEDVAMEEHEGGHAKSWIN